MSFTKHLGLAIVTATALIAFVGTSVASAAAFTAGATGKAFSTTAHTGYLFVIQGAEVKCPKSKFIGQTESTSTNILTAHPEFEECEFVGTKTTVNTEGCHFTFIASTDGAGKATVNLSGCTKGGITITASIPIFMNCTVFIKNQSIASAAAYTNASGVIQVELTATSVHAEVTKSTGFCPLTPGTSTSAAHTGQSTWSASGTTLTYDS